MGCRPVTGSPLLLPVVVVVVVAVVVWSLTFRSLEYYPGNDTLPRWVCTLGPSGVEYRRVIRVASDNVRRARLGRCKGVEARGFTCLQHEFAAKL